MDCFISAGRVGKKMKKKKHRNQHQNQPKSQEKSYFEKMKKILHRCLTTMNNKTFWMLLGKI